MEAWNMTVFLTSHTGGWDRVDGKRIPAPLNSDNGFTDHLKSRWNDGSKVMFIAADPIAAERNDSIRDAFLVAFPMSGLSISDITICDGRNEARFRTYINMMPSFSPAVMFRRRMRSFSGLA